MPLRLGPQVWDAWGVGRLGGPPCPARWLRPARGRRPLGLARLQPPPVREPCPDGPLPARRWSWQRPRAPGCAWFGAGVGGRGRSSLAAAWPCLPAFCCECAVGLDRPPRSRRQWRRLALARRPRCVAGFASLPASPHRRFAWRCRGSLRCFPGRASAAVAAALSFSRRWSGFRRPARLRRSPRWRRGGSFRPTGWRARCRGLRGPRGAAPCQGLDVGVDRALQRCLCWFEGRVAAAPLHCLDVEVDSALQCRVRHLEVVRGLCVAEEPVSRWRRCSSRVARGAAAP